MPNLSRDTAQFLEIEVPGLDHAQNLRLIQSKEQCFSPSTVYLHKGMKSGRVQHATHRNSLSLVGDADITRIAGTIEEHIFRNLGAITAALGARAFKPSKSISSCVCFKDGAFFKRHTDVVYEQEGRRKLTYVYYLNSEPKRFAGGDLLMFDGNRVTATIEATNGKVVVFQSHTAHEVSKVQLSPDGFGDARLTITGFISGKPSVKDRLVYLWKSFRSMLRSRNWHRKFAT